MAFFDLFRTSGIDEGLRQYENTSGAALLDVRTPQEYAQGHLPGSRNIPLDEIGQAAEAVTDLNTPLFIYWHSGARSAQATAALRRMGFQHVTNIGGISAYRGKVEY